MSFLKALYQKYLTFIVRRVERREVALELRAHLELRIEENLDAGMSPAEAREEAYQRFGNFLRIQQACMGIKQLKSEGIMNAFLNDLRYGSRMLWKKPGFTVVAIVTLALGIGVNSSIFSIVNAVLLRPLPYKQPERIIQFWTTNPTKGWNDDKAPCSPGDLVDWKEQNQSFEQLAAYYIGSNKSADPKGVLPSEFFLTGNNDAVRLQGLKIIGNLFSVLGVSPEIGRDFQSEETWEGKGRVAILSHGLWQRNFHSDPSIVGKEITLNGVQTTVIGIMPASFYFPSKEVEIWIPYGWNKATMADFRPAHMFRVIGRLKSGVTLSQAQAEMSGIAKRLEQQYPNTNKSMGVGLAIMHDWDVTDTKFALLLFLGAVAFVLLIACANVANLLLARGATRMKEFALRAALGAERGRLIRQLLTENLLLSTVGGTAGLLLATLGNRMVVSFNPGGIPRLDEVALDYRVLGFTVAITFLTAMIFGLVPALASSRTDLNEALKDAGQKGGQPGKGSRMRNLLVMAEIALSLVLIIGAGLMIKSFIRLQQTSPGFEPSNVLTLKTYVSGPRYNSESKQLVFYNAILDRIRALPGVQSAGAISVPPTKGSTFTSDYSIEGHAQDDYIKEALVNVATPNYFETMKIPLVAGRTFSDMDTGANRVFIISEAVARRYFPNQNPVGQKMKYGRPDSTSPWQTIVGIVKDVKQEGLVKDARPQVYEPMSQMANNYMTFVVRTSGDPRSLIASVRQEIKAIDKDVPPFNISTMGELVDNSISQQRFTMLLLIVFAGVALLLASVGIYGVMSYTILQRTGEIGIRMALGAQRRDILTMVIGQGLKLIVAGLVIGLIGSLLLTRLMMTLLYSVSPTDPAVFLLISILLASVGLLACFVPARRATRVDPILALRYE